MSILFCTPCYGGQVTTHHFQSCLDLKEVLTQREVEHDWLLMWNESLVQRARNNLVKQFWETENEKLMFIDADIEFTAEDVCELWNMETDIAVGVLIAISGLNDIKASRDMLKTAIDGMNTAQLKALDVSDGIHW